MLESIALLRCLTPALTRTTVRQLSRIVLAMLAMTGRVTMRGIARWAGAGGSYRTVQETPALMAGVLGSQTRERLALAPQIQDLVFLGD